MNFSQELGIFGVYFLRISELLEANINLFYSIQGSFLKHLFDLIVERIFIKFKSSSILSKVPIDLF